MNAQKLNSDISKETYFTSKETCDNSKETCYTSKETYSANQTRPTTNEKETSATNENETHYTTQRDDRAAYTRLEGWRDVCGIHGADSSDTRLQSCHILECFSHVTY
jgi:hypothetical protein